MSFGSLSYRNGKYQGFINNQLQRHGLGILIDDDLTFHVSNWHENKMQGSTLIYLAHAKYIYGEWKNNQPHGLNVYRSGDTVLLSKYVFGVPSNRCLLIFERHSFACILGENNKQWQIIKSGLLVNHTSLMKFIEMLQVDVPEHYLSLIKFACAFSNHNNSIKTFPCHQKYCYFGYINGLAIVFNNNNGLVTVGQHKNEELCDFGGKFINKKCAEQGNFALNGETVEYKGERPTQKIYQIYQRTHKRDTNFINEIYESKTKIFNSMQSLIINKLKQIVEENRKTGMGRFDLNESLDYQEYNEEESLKLHEIRDQMYSPPKKVFQKPNQAYTPSKIETSTLSQNQSSLLKKSMKKPLMSQLEIPKTANQEPKMPKQQRQSKRTIPNRVERHQRSLDQTQFQDPNSNFLESAKYDQPTQQANQSSKSNLKNNSAYINSVNRKQNLPSRQREYIKQSPSYDRIQVYPNSKEINRNYSIPSTNFFKDTSNNLEQTSTFKRILQEQEEMEERKTEEESMKMPATQVQKQDVVVKERPSHKKRQKSIDQFARPTYEDIEERRRRLLKDFQQLNAQSPVKMNRPEKKPIVDSPYQSNLISIQRDDQSSFGYIPLSISNKINQKKEKGVIKSRQSDRLPQQQNQQSQKREKSSNRRLNYNYSNLDSTLAASENKQLTSVSQPSQQPQSQSQPIPSPIRQKRTYQYVYE